MIYNKSNNMIDILYNNFDISWHELIKQHEENLLLAIDKSNNCISYPPSNLIFRVFSMPINQIKIVLLGQDPYHKLGQATGLSFSCNNEKKLQPSLNNIFKEIINEFPERNYTFKTGDLTRWFTEEKIFLLNSALTVEEGKPMSLMHLWETFTDDVIKYIANNNENCIFVLLGKHAQNKEKYINDENRIIKCIHPSPLSAYRGFFNSNLFIDIETKIGKVNWEI